MGWSSAGPLSFFTACVAVLACSAPLQAQSSQPAAEGTPRFYGYELLLVDLAALGGGMLIGTVNDGGDRQRAGDVIASTWGLGMVGALTVHVAHDNGGRGLASTGMRLLVPPLTALGGVVAHCTGVGADEPCSAVGGRGGFVVGMVGASLLDAFAFADEEPRRKARSWYGLPTLMIDGAALATGIGIAVGKSDSTRGETAANVLVLPYVVGIFISPWVHAFNGHVGTAFGSLALRAFAPALGAVGGMAGYCAASGSEKRCTNEGALYGLLGGTLLTAIIDIGLMSHETAGPETATVAPFVLPRRGGLLTGLAGAF